MPGFGRLTQKRLVEPFLRVTVNPQAGVTQNPSRHPDGLRIPPNQAGWENRDQPYSGCSPNRSIQPGSTETYQLLYTVPKNRPAITGVTLGHRAPGSDDFTFAFVARQLHSGSSAVGNGQNDWLTSVRQLPK